MKANPSKSTKGRRLIRNLVKDGRLLEYVNSQYSLNVFFLNGTFEEYRSVVEWLFGKETAADLGDGDTYCAFTMRAQIPENGAYGYVVWLQDSGPEMLVNIVHECVHASGFSLADCNLPTDIENEKTSESVAYLTADMFRFVVSRLYPQLGIAEKHEILGDFKSSEPTKQSNEK